MYTNKKLYEKALSHHTTNSSEVIDDIWDNEDWSNVEIWEPFENWSIDLLQTAVNSLYGDFIDIRDYEK